MKLYIISNRLPVKAAGSNGTFVFSRSEGGLATGLDSLQTSYEKHWIGWPGVCTDNEKDRQEMNEKLQEMNFHPVFLSEKQIQNFTSKDIIMGCHQSGTFISDLQYFLKLLLRGKPLVVVGGLDFSIKNTQHLDYTLISSVLL